jgi:hypothetical protein
MNADNIQVIDDFMIFSGMLNDDIDMMCDFIKDKLPKSIKKYKRSRVKTFIEKADYMKIREEVDYLLDLSTTEYKTYVIFYRLKQKAEASSCDFMQTTIDDFR